MEVSKAWKGAKCTQNVKINNDRFKSILILIALIACIAYVFIQARGSEQVDESRVGSDEEVRLTNTLEAIEGVGRVKVYFHYNKANEKTSKDELFSQYFRQSTESNENLAGLLVVAEGADNIFIREQLISTISRILQLPTHRIVIVAMKKEEEFEK